MRYEFTSSLSPAEVAARIRARTRCTTGGTGCDNTLYHKQLDDARFMLLKTGRFGLGRGQPAFWLELSPRDGGTVIRCRYGPAKSADILLCAFCALPLVAALRMNGPAFLLVFLLPWAFWVFLVLGFFHILAPRLWKKQGDAVLAFIKAELLD
ncbi:MAG: hypothetical protein ACI4PC_02715 [Oscillospiraceae bacterium]